MDVNANLDVSGTYTGGGLMTTGGNIVIPDAGNIGSASDTDAISISSGGVVAVTATTANTSATDGALTVAGGAGVAADLSVGDDLRLISDSAVLSFGADSDVTLTHAADTSLTCNLMMAATTFEPSGDTASGDNAAIGYTAGEGLILTGQGSTNDVTIKNDADADVITIATGGTNVAIAGGLTLGTDLAVAHGGTGASTYTANNVLLGNGTSAFQTVAPSTSGNVLTSNGSTWTSAAGPSGGLVFLQGVTASNSADIQLTSGIDSTYETYLIVFNNIVPATDNVTPYIRTSTDGGSNYDSSSSNYRYAGWRNSDGGYNSFNSTGATEFHMCDTGVNVGSESGECWNATLWLFHPSNSSLRTYMRFEASWTAQGAQTTWAGGACARLTNGDVDALQFYFSSGNVESGEANLYGLVKS
jgi:hypothetical protein